MNRIINPIDREFREMKLIFRCSKYQGPDSAHFEIQKRSVLQTHYNAETLNLLKKEVAIKNMKWITA
jgi:hypothetical protein